MSLLLLLRDNFPGPAASGARFVVQGKLRSRPTGRPPRLFQSPFNSGGIKASLIRRATPQKAVLRPGFESRIIMVSPVAANPSRLELARVNEKAIAELQ